jgi:triosephosphate isomerase
MQKLIIANWKSNKSLAAASQWVEEFAGGLGERAGACEVVGAGAQDALELRAKVVVAPGFSLLQTVSEALDGFAAPAHLGAQDVSPFPLGSYTGAVAASSLKELGVSYCIVGHSERRKHFHETDAEVAAKVLRLTEAGITPVLCIDTEYLESQLAAIESALLSQLVVAYEPLSAIGTGNNQDVGTVAVVVAQIKSLCGENVPVLYGGSVKPENVAEYMLVSDGALVGGASLEATEFQALLERV